MREILFRGKRTDNGEWVFGSVVHQTDYYGDRCDRWFILEGDFTNDYDIDYPIEIQKETVGQCTGLTDKNGTRIFEGDIIRTSKYGKVLNDYNSNGEDTFCVVYRPALFRLEREKPPRGFNLVDDGFSKMEVIGNIHDNPELLEGGGIL